MTPLELYYQQKATQKVPEEAVKAKAVKQFLGTDSDILLKKNHPGLLMQLFDILDRPGNATRALLVGKLGGLKGLIPFAGVLEDLTGLPFKLRPEERVPGTELLETWFGKMQQRPGKIDPVDALGLVSEIALDPLWLVGGLGLTKLAKAKQLVKSGIRGAGTLEEKALIRAAINAARKGQKIEGIQSKALSNALKTVYSSGQSPSMAKHWAEQAARGERAAITVMGKPLITGGKTFWDMAEANAEILRKSYLGQKFLPSTRRVGIPYEELHPMVVHEARDIPVSQTAEAAQEMERTLRTIPEGLGEQETRLGEVMGVQSKIEQQIAAKKDELFRKISAKADTKGLNRKLADIERIRGQIRDLELERDRMMPTAPTKEVYTAPERPKTQITAPLAKIPEVAVKPAEMPSGAPIVKPDLSKMSNEELTAHFEKLRGEKFSAREPAMMNPHQLQKYMDELRYRYKGAKGPDEANKIKAAFDEAASYAPSTRKVSLYKSRIAKEIQGHELYDKVKSDILSSLEDIHAGPVGKTFAGEVRTFLEGRPSLKGKIPIFEGSKAASRSHWDSQLTAYNHRTGKDLSTIDDWLELVDLKNRVLTGKVSELVLEIAAQHGDESMKWLASAWEMVKKGYSYEDIKKAEREFFGGEVGEEITRKFRVPTIEPQYNLENEQIASLKRRLDEMEYAGSPRDRKLKRKLQNRIFTLENKLGQKAVGLENMRRFTKYDLDRLKHKTKYESRIQQLLGRQKELQKQIDTRVSRIRRAQEFISDEKSAELKRMRGRQAFLGGEESRLLQEIPETNRPAAVEDILRTRQADEAMLAAEREFGGTKGGIRISELEQPLMYVHRTPTLEFREWLEEYKKTPMYKTRSLRPTLGAAKRRSVITGGMTTEEVEQYYRNLGYQGEQVFEQSLPRAEFSRKAQHYRAMGNKQAINKAVNSFKKPASKAAPDDVPLNQFFDTIGMVHDRAETSKWVLPKDIVGAFTAIDRMPGKMDAFWKHWTNINRFMKGLFTLPLPAYYAKNVIGDIMLGYLDGVVDPRHYANSFLIQRAIGKAKKISIARNIPMDEAARMVKFPQIQTPFGMKNGYDIWKLSQQHGVTGQTLGIMHIGELPGGPGQQKARTWYGRAFMGQGKGWDIGRGVAENTENWPRMAHYLHSMSQGLDPSMAARRVKEFHFDYGDLSEFEKRILRDRLFFFYTFSRKNLPRQIQSLAQTPGKQAIFSHLAGGTPTAQGEGQYYPDWWQEQLIAKTPLRKEGVPVRLMSTGFPIEEAFSRFAAPGVGWTRVRRLAARNIAQMQPTITKPIELATGKSLYFDQPITKFNQWLLEASPMGRFASTYRQFQNPAETVNTKLGGFVTGLRTRKFELEKQKQWKIREIARKFLSQYPDIRVRPDYYVSKEKKAGLPEDVALALQVQ